MEFQNIIFIMVTQNQLLVIFLILGRGVQSCKYAEQIVISWFIMEVEIIVVNNVTAETILKKKTLLYHLPLLN